MSTPHNFLPSPSGAFLSCVVSCVFLFSGDSICVRFRSLRFVCAGGFKGGLGRGGAAVVLLGDYQAIRAWLFQVWIIKTRLGFFWCWFCEGHELWLGRLVLVMFGHWMVCVCGLS
jgi:hypothetical protein